MRTAAYFLVFAAFCFHGAFLIWRLGIFFKNGPAKKRVGVFAASALFLALALSASRYIPVRGARANEHEFASMSLDFFSAVVDGTHREALFEEAEKEISPLAWFSLADFTGGFSLEGVLASQKFLLALCALLVFAALSISGFSPWSAAFAALLLGFNFLSWISMHSFSTTLVNLFYLLSSLCALMALAHEGLKRFLANMGWFLCASFLVLSSRYELLPVPVMGVFIFVIFSRELRESLRAQPSRAAFAAMAAVFTAAAAVWIFVLGQLTKPNAEPMFKIFDSARYHLGQGNLGRLFPIPFEVFSWLPYVFMAATCFLAWRNKKRGALTFWTIFGCVWGLYSASVFTLVGLFPLEYVRHHLYFFLPFIFLSAVFLESLLRLDSRKIFWLTGAAMFLGAYFFLGVRRLEATKTLLRTNDREWQFILKARRAWPVGCGAVYPFVDSRSGILKKYFPSKGAVEGGCRLIYRSPYHQIFNLYGPVYDSYPPEAEAFYGETWMEETFEHAFYTDWHGPFVGSKAERLLPIPVRAGFYYPSVPGSARLLSAASGWPRLLKKLNRPRRFELFSGSTGYLKALEICYKKAMSDEAELERAFFMPPEALACFDKALEEAPEEEREALLASRAMILEAMR